MSCHLLLQGIFLTEELYLCLKSALADGFFTTSATWKAPYISVDINDLEVDPDVNAYIDLLFTLFL